MIVQNCQEVSVRLCNSEWWGHIFLISEMLWPIRSTKTKWLSFFPQGASFQGTPTVIHSTQRTMKLGGLATQLYWVSIIPHVLTLLLLLHWVSSAFPWILIWQANAFHYIKTVSVSYNENNHNRTEKNIDTEYQLTAYHESALNVYIAVFLQHSIVFYVLEICWESVVL